jgi:hypothetical protein
MEASMEENKLSARALLCFGITLISPLFPVGVLSAFDRIAQAGMVCLVSFVLLVLTLWAVIELWRRGMSRAMRIIGTATGGVGAVLGLVVVVSAWMIFRTMS